MDISIFGYKLNLEVLILIGVIYLILVGHTFCSCCSLSFNEGLEVMDMSGAKQKVMPPNFKPENVMMGTQVSPNNTADKAGKPAPAPASPEDVDKKTADKKKKNAPLKNMEGFVGANTNYGESSSYSLYSNKPINTSLWNAPDMTVNGNQLSPGVKAFLARPKQPVPLPEGEMLLFANTKFAPEYCPNTYSNSMGCAAMTGEQYNYLITRGGNNTPYSEY
jgi:hypothetical protein